MKLWVDDIRYPPPSWDNYVWTRTASAAINALRTQEFDEVSLDHDLGDSLENGEGYDILLWIENEVRRRGWKPPHIWVHTSNTPARARMERAIKAITDHLDTI